MMMMMKTVGVLVMIGVMSVVMVEANEMQRHREFMEQHDAQLQVIVDSVLGFLTNITDTTSGVIQQIENDYQPRVDGMLEQINNGITEATRAGRSGRETKSYLVGRRANYLRVQSRFEILATNIFPRLITTFERNIPTLEGYIATLPIIDANAEAPTLSSFLAANPQALAASDICGA